MQEKLIMAEGSLHITMQCIITFECSVTVFTGVNGVVKQSKVYGRVGGRRERGKWAVNGITGGSCHKYLFCHDKSVFAATKLLL